MSKETINLPRLISLVANGAGVDPVTARRFLHELFAKVEDCLIAGESVEVRGIGEFRRGDDISAPVLFQADQQLADIANEPFSVFTPVELNEGAEAEISAADEKEPDKPVEQATPVSTETAKPLEPSEPSDSAEPSEPSEPSDYAEPSEPSDSSESSDSAAPSEPSDPAETSGTSELSESPESPEDGQPALELEQEPRAYSTVLGRARRVSTSDDVSYDDDYGYEEQPRGQSGHTMWLLLGLLIGLILGLVGGYFAGKTMAKYEFDEEEMTAYLENDSIAGTDGSLMFEETALVTEHTPTAEVADTASASTAVAVNAAQPEAAKAPAAQPSAETPKAEPVYDTVTSNRYLSILAKEHYGVKNYWVFIYEANPGLGNPNTVKSGTRVLIPAKESFMEATEEQTKAKAAKLMGQILSRYK